MTCFLIRITFIELQNLNLNRFGVNEPDGFWHVDRQICLCLIISPQNVVYNFSKKNFFSYSVSNSLIALTKYV